MVPGTVFLGLNDTFIKRLLNTGIQSELLAGLNFSIIGALVFIAAWIWGLPEIKPGFWEAFIITVVINIAAQFAWYRAFQAGEASFVSAMRLVTPPLVLLTGFFVLGEVPSLLGALGVLTTIAGLWFLVDVQFDKGMRLHERIREPAFLYAFLGAFLFAFSFPYDKQAVVASSAFFFLGAAFLLIGMGNLLLGYALIKDRANFFTIPRAVVPIFLISIPVQTAGVFLTLQALNYSLAAYAASTKRLWSFWGVLFSGALLKEKNIGKKLLAVLLMLFGIVLTIITDFH